MKQYIHTTDQSVILALGHYSFVLTWSTGEGHGQDPSQIHAYELLPPPPTQKPTNPTPPKKKQKENNETEAEKKSNDENILPSTSVDSSNVVEAVVSKWNASMSTLMCAVTRKDKSLCIYNIDTTVNNNNTDEKTSYQKMEPTLTHKSPKRCCTLAIASYPIPSNNDKDANGNGNGNPTTQDVIIAGDMNGDAIAFPTIALSIPGKVYRTLLGHTASVLTSVKVIQSSIQPNSTSTSTSTSDLGPLLFTADRDEKVRISSLYKPWNVYGYLLGHASFVSDMHVVTSYGNGGTNNTTLCVTCSGDGTLRVWDVIACQELGQLSINDEANEANNEGSEGVEEAMDVTNEDVNDENKEEEQGSSHVPVRMAVNANGTTVAMIRDGMHQVQVYSISLETNNGTSKAVIEKVQQIECPSQPLGITFQGNDSFCVLMKDPSYFTQYVNTSTIDDSSSEQKILFTTKDACGLVSTVKSIASELEIQMVGSVLERDETTGKTIYTKNIQVESEVFSKKTMFLDKGRKEKAKQADRRSKQRKRARKREEK